MKNLSTNYLGLELKNPLIAGASGLTSSVSKIKELADNGAGAIVLKSLFEEQIQAELSANLESYNTDYPGATDYVKEYTRGTEVDTYLDLISETKNEINIPVIASINCVSATEWVSFANSVEEEGADAVELNISLLPSNPRLTSEESEQNYIEIITKVSEMISLPIALKMSQYSASLANLIVKLSQTGKVDGFVLFNRYFTPDINIEKMELISSNILSTPVEAKSPLRWIALMSGLIENDLAASTGVHDGAGLVKMLLAGATAVQVVSTLYKNGAGQLGVIIDELEDWMEKKSFSSLDDFRGKLSYANIENPEVFERTQFMKYFGGLAK